MGNGLPSHRDRELEEPQYPAASQREDAGAEGSQGHVGAVRQRAPGENLAAKVGAPGSENPESRNDRLIRLGYTSEIPPRRDSLKRRKKQHLREDSNLQPAAPKLRLS